MFDINDPHYQAAAKQVADEKGFYGHLGSYLLVNLFLFLVDCFTLPGHWWFFWPLLGWGIGLASHAFQVFGRGILFSEDWKERRIKDLMEKHNRK